MPYPRCDPWVVNDGFFSRLPAGTALVLAAKDPLGGPEIKVGNFGKGFKYWTNIGWVSLLRGAAIAIVLFPPVPSEGRSQQQQGSYRVVQDGMKQACLAVAAMNQKRVCRTDVSKALNVTG